MNRVTAEWKPIPVDTEILYRGVSGRAGAFFMSIDGGALFARGTWHRVQVSSPAHLGVAAADGFLLLTPEGSTWKVSSSGAVEPGPVAQAGPHPRLNNPALAFDSDAGRVLLFGGTYFEKGKQKDESAVWAWEKGGWQQLKTAGKVTPRSNALAAWVPPLRSLVVLGGWNDRKGAQLETLHLEGKRWTVFETAGDSAPTQRRLMLLAWDEVSGQLICAHKAPSVSELWLHRYLGAGRWEQVGVVEGCSDTPLSYDQDARQLVSAMTVAKGERGTYAVVPVGAWLDGLSKVDWAAAAPAPAEAAGGGGEVSGKAPVPQVAKQTWLRFREEGSDKFWFATLDGNRYTLRWGKRGTAGQSKDFTLDSEEKAAKELAKKIQGKLDDGYEHAPEGAAAAEVAGRRAFAMSFTEEQSGEGDWISGAPGAATPWPRCSHCSKPMEHLATFHAHPQRLPLTAHEAVAVFQCATGSCPAYQPGSGANAVLGVKGSGTARAEVPAGLEVQSAQSIEYEEGVLERERGEDDDEPSPQGSKLGGYPTWVHGPPEPDALNCTRCKKELRFVGQLDAGDTGMNFGDVGLGYVFFCADGCEGRFLSQG